MLSYSEADEIILCWKGNYIGTMRNTWNKNFEKTMNHTYMILSEDVFFEEAKDVDYRKQMLLHNRIPGLLPVSDQMMNGENSLYYEISSLTSLEEMYQQKEMDYEVIKELLLGCMKIFSELEEYLLDASQLILTPEYIYLHPQTKQPLFTFYPGYEKDARRSFMDFIDYILTNLDHSDEETVMLGYQVYRITRNPNFTMQDLEPLLLKENKVEMPILQDMTAADETVLLTPSMREEWKVKEVIKEKAAQKPVIKKQLPTDIVGMLIAVGVILVVGAVLFVSLNTRSLHLSSQTQMYMVGVIIMAFLSIGLLGYSYSKKRMQEEPS